MHWKQGQSESLVGSGDRSWNTTPNPLVCKWMYANLQKTEVKLWVPDGCPGFSSFIVTWPLPSSVPFSAKDEHSLYLIRLNFDFCGWWLNGWSHRGSRMACASVHRSVPLKNLMFRPGLSSLCFVSTSETTDTITSLSRACLPLPGFLDIIHCTWRIYLGQQPNKYDSFLKRNSGPSCDVMKHVHRAKKLCEAGRTWNKVRTWKLFCLMVFVSDILILRRRQPPW